MASFNGRARVAPPVNEPIRAYAPGSPERASLKAALDTQAAEQIDIPIVIGGEAIRTGDTARVVMPHDHQHVLGTWHKATPALAEKAVAAALAAHKEWSGWSFEDRAAVFLKAAELLTTSWRDPINAATMLGQSKTAFQAEIDSACEIIDFWRFNVHYAEELLAEQPLSDHTMWNRLEYRGLEGFVYAVTPFNFTSIAANLPTAPALMGNTVVWKPASSAMFSAHYLMRLFEAAGLPPGVINFLPGDAAAISSVVLPHRDLAGVHFTGSTDVFNSMWKTIGASMAYYRSYPRVVGETGGKDFILAHASADPAALATAIVRGGFEFQGQKCSAVSRIYVPRSLWHDVRDRVVAMMNEIGMGDIRDFRNFMGAVIDERAFDRITGHIAEAKRTATTVFGGESDKSTGYYIRPTLIETDDPGFRQLCEEIFGPVVTAYVYDDAMWTETLDLVDRTSPYALTGAIFAQDRRAVVEASSALRYAAGNFYINDKPTGAVVGQQPFGGARASGTNDKAGSKMNLMRWVSARTVKENFNPPRDYRYPFMGAE
ncbi:MAG TPA: L-glutamate gamma-semialdehyde dehydrogenase [Vicinamibacterales bacterium]|nr:L-glutamate gamma-semialdehyde dehydrogenase [Vicinamibacterales bacterium]